MLILSMISFSLRPVFANIGSTSIHVCFLALSLTFKEKKKIYAQACLTLLSHSFLSRSVFLIFLPPVCTEKVANMWCFLYVHLPAILCHCCRYFPQRSCWNCAVRFPNNVLIFFNKNKEKELFCVCVFYICKSDTLLTQSSEAWSRGM